MASWSEVLSERILPVEEDLNGIVRKAQIQAVKITIRTILDMIELNLGEEAKDSIELIKSLRFIDAR